MKPSTNICLLFYAQVWDMLKLAVYFIKLANIETKNSKFKTAKRKYATFANETNNVWKAFTEGNT